MTFFPSKSALLRDISTAFSNKKCLQYMNVLKREENWLKEWKRKFSTSKTLSPSCGLNLPVNFGVRDWNFRDSNCIASAEIPPPDRSFVIGPLVADEGENKLTDVSVEGKRKKSKKILNAPTYFLTIPFFEQYHHKIKIMCFFKVQVLYFQFLPFFFFFFFP